ncbi:MAG: HAD family phosphatase [Thermoleophilaceae bacterium]|nr:HAD family phosphatase [Thermoleophilaceae bacterium]
MSPIRAVISDFGGVLTSPLSDAFRGYQETAGIEFGSLGIAMQAIAERTGEHPLFELEKGTLTEADFRAALEQEVGRELAPFAESWFDHLHTNDAMLAYLRELKEERGLRVGMLTNNVREWEPLWRPKVPGLDEIFEVVVDSAFVGMRKPDPAIYALTLERMGGLEFADCLFVDDLEPNIDAARELGMSAVRFDTTEQAIAEMDAALP